VTIFDSVEILREATAILRGLVEPRLYEIALATSFQTTANALMEDRVVVGLAGILSAARDVIDARSEGRL